MSELTSRALDFCRGGFSPSESAVLATMGRSISPAAIQRIEVICAADLNRRNRERLERRAA